MKRPIIPVWARWLIMFVAILAGLFALACAVIVGPLFYACAVNGDCV